MNLPAAVLGYYDSFTRTLMKQREADLAATGESDLDGYEPRKGKPEIAWGGTPIFGGIVQDEYNPDLKGRKSLETAEKMRRTLGTIRACERLISLPIRSTPWFVEPANGAGSAETEAAELLQENLMGGMEGSFDDLLREACLASYFGFRVPEIVWEDRGNYAAIRKIASRNPARIDRWVFDAGGNLAGFVYVGNRPVGTGLSTWATQQVRYQRLPIPIEKTLHFVWDYENENMQGLGLWRSMYPHWYFVQALMLIVGIGVERNLLGYPIGRLDPELYARDPAPDMGALLNLIRNMRASDDAGAVLPPGYNVEMLESKRSLLDAIPILMWNIEQIVSVVLGNWLTLGKGSQGGTQALAVEQVKMFRTAENGAASWIAETINRQLVRRWVRLNYGDGLKPPVLRFKTLQEVDPQAWGVALQAISGAGFLHPVPEDERYVRDALDLPAIPMEQLQSAEKERRAKADAMLQAATPGPEASEPEQGGRRTGQGNPGPGAADSGDDGGDGGSGGGEGE